MSLRRGIGELACSFGSEAGGARLSTTAKLESCDRLTMAGGKQAS